MVKEELKALQSNVLPVCSPESREYLGKALRRSEPQKCLLTRLKLWNADRKGLDSRMWTNTKLAQILFYLLFFPQLAEASLQCLLLPHWDKIQTGESWKRMVAEAGGRAMGRYLEGFVFKASMQITGQRNFFPLLLPFSNIFSYLFNLMHFSVSVSGC